MGDWGDSALSFIKLSPRWLTPLALAAGVVLFGPSALIRTLGLDAVLNTYRGWIGAAFVVIVSLLAVAGLDWAWQRARVARQRTIRERESEAALIAKLEGISQREADIIRHLMSHDIAHLQETAYVTRLQRDGMIRPVTHYEYELTPAVRVLLERDPDCATILASVRASAQTGE